MSVTTPSTVRTLEKEYVKGEYEESLKEFEETLKIECEKRVGGRESFIRI